MSQQIQVDNKAGIFVFVETVKCKLPAYQRIKGLITSPTFLMLFQNAPLNLIITTLNLPACRNMASCLLQFLDIEEIIAISQAYKNSNQLNYFIHLVQNSCFIRQYINKTDKSLYFSFYSEDQYRKIELSQIAGIAQEKSNIFLTYHNAFKSVIEMLEQKIPIITEQLQFVNNLIADPDLPIPKLKRETQGIHCSSPFQLFLICQFFNKDDEETCYGFQSFREFLNMQKEEQYVKQFINIYKTKQNPYSQQLLRKIMKVRYAPYEVTMNNFKDFLIQDNQLHNFIVGLFSLTDIMLEATHTYISLIQDPLHRLIELLLRYSIFRNYVLAVQEYLSFTFKMYEGVYIDSIEQASKKPKYTFWRPALTKWFLKMDYLISSSIQVYMHCLTKLRNTRICQHIKQKCIQNQFHYGKILNKVQLNSYEYTLAPGIYNGNLNTSSEIGIFFDNHPQNYQILVMQFNEYMVDISINQQTVHWCGYSNHQLERPYLQYEEKFIGMNRDYIEAVVGYDGQISQLNKNEIMKIDVQYLSILQIKNRTLKKVVDSINADLDLSGEHLVTFEFDEDDRKLEYFNKKAQILAEIDENQRPFYSIPPYCSAEKLIDMLDTNASQNNSGSQSNKYYHSQSQSQQNESNNHNINNFEHELTEVAQKEGKKSSIPIKRIFAEDYEQYKIYQSKSNSSRSIEKN